MALVCVRLRYQFEGVVAWSRRIWVSVSAKSRIYAGFRNFFGI